MTTPSAVEDEKGVSRNKDCFSAQLQTHSAFPFQSCTMLNPTSIFLS